MAFALFTSSSARADGFDVQRYQPSERGSSWFVLESLDLRGGARPAAGVVLDYQNEPLVIRSADGSVRTALVDHVVTANVGGAVTFLDRLRVGANVPVVLSTSGDGGTVRGVTYAPPNDSTTLGDVRVAVDGRLFGEHDGPITMALGARLLLPTGSPSSYTGDGTVRVEPHLLAAGTVSLFTYAAKVGILVRNPDTSAFDVGTELLYAASAGVRFDEGRATIGPELFGSTNLEQATFKTATSPLEALIGGHYGLPVGLRFGAGVGAGIVSGIGTPSVRVLGSVEWMPELAVDTDGDGVPDKEDACRTASGVRSADPAKNGCPPPPPKVDTDGDGIPDDVDACMDVPGQPTGDPRTNGCADRDGDGILDPLDHCPDQPGPHTEDPATNGCPPNPDRDGDGIPNEKDACPDEAGKPDANPGRNGCPMAYVNNGQIRIRDKVRFKGNTAEILPESDAALQGVAAFLRAHSEIPKVRVEGHTDNRGDPKKNLKLSQDRAAAVVKWLVAQGIDADRLVAEGFGMSRPIDENDTEEGRENNRRVELHIVTGDAGKK